MRKLIAAIIGCAAAYLLTAFIHNDIAWFGLLYNNGIEGATDTDSVDRVAALVLFIVAGLGAAMIDDAL